MIGQKICTFEGVAIFSSIKTGQLPGALLDFPCSNPLRDVRISARLCRNP